MRAAQGTATNRENILKRVAVVLMASVALMSVVFVSGAVGHTFRADTTVSVKYDKPKPNDPNANGSFGGNVSSEKPRCEKKRTVTLVQRTATGPTNAGTTVTDASGAWKIAPSASVPPGSYYAKVAKRVIRKNTKHRHICKRAVSKDVTVK